MKNVFCTAVAVLAMVGLSGTAQAKSLEDILRDKGVITEEDYKEAVKNNDLASYVPGKGITAQSRDGNYVAHVGGRLQARYTFESFDDSAEEDESSFSIRRMKFWLSGNVFSKDLTYKWQMNFGGGDSVLEDAWAAYQFAKPFKLTVGQMKPAQSRQELTSSGKQLFIDRSLANDTFNLGYDLGVQASGSFADHLVEYMVGGFNGNGGNESNVEDEHMFAARIDINPFGQYKMDEVSFGDDKLLLNIGGSFATATFIPGDAGNVSGGNEIYDKALDLDGNLDPENSATFIAAFGDELDWDLYTANLHARWKGATFGAEYFRLNAEPDTGDDFDADGYYVQAGYMVVPKTLELAARYSAIESTDDNAPEQFDKQEYQAGVNYYFAKHNAKLQADYTHVKDDLNDDADDNIIRLQAQVIF
jgi:phosphate-selective porin